MRSSGVADDYFQDLRRSFQETTETSLVNVMRAGMQFRLPAGLDKANLPVLVVVGSKEYPAMKQSARDLMAALPNACGVMVSLGSKSSLAKEHNWGITGSELSTATVKAWIEDRPHD